MRHMSHMKEFFSLSLWIFFFVTGIFKRLLLPPADFWNILWAKSVYVAGIALML